MEIKTNNISRSFFKAAKWQAYTTLFTMLIASIWGIHAVLSALVGGSAVIAGAYSGYLVVRTKQGGSAGIMLLTLLKAEVIKILVVAILLLIAFKTYQRLIPLSLIVGLAGSALASGAGLRTVQNESKN